MKRNCLWALALTLAMAANAQTKGGGITPEMLSDIRSRVKMTPADKALANAIAANSIDNLAKNKANANEIDTYFSIETPKQSITDQQSSGRCWMFSGLNVLRANYAKRTDSLQVEFSQAYLFFYDQLEKANLFLQAVIDHADKPIDDARVQFFFKHPINDGGTFCGVADLADKYGLVPKSVMAETHSSDNTSRMSRLIASKLREAGLMLRKMVADGKKTSDIKKAKAEQLAIVYKMLQLCIGEPPAEFDYAFKNKSGKTVTKKKTYTPKTFFEEVVGQPLNGSFIMAMNDPRRPYGKTYEVEYDRHTYDGHNWKYLNLSMDDISRLAIAAL